MKLFITIYSIPLYILILLIIIVSAEPARPQTVWTYDFGDGAAGTHTSDESEAFLPPPQPNGGTARVRIGTGDGIIDLENPGSTNLGTFAQLQITGATNASDNLFQIYGFDGDSTFYIKFSFKLTGGNSGTIGFLFGNGPEFGENTGYIGDSFAGFRSTFQGDTLFTERRTASDWSDAFDIDSVFVKDEIYTAEIYANNTGNAATYYRNGKEQTLPSREWSLWIDGIKFDDFGSVGLETGDVIDGYLFYAQNSAGNTAQIEIDDIVYSNSLPHNRDIKGDAGWRMLSAPAGGVTVEQLARQSLVQGIDGLNYSGAAANIYTRYEGDGNWRVPANVSTLLNSGEGFIWYLYDNADIPESKPLPLGFVVAGDEPDTDIMVTLHQVPDSGGEIWNLVGNPFGTALNISDVENWTTGGTLESAIGYIWDPLVGSYVLSSANTNRIGAWQGFFIQNNNAEALEIPDSARTGDGTNFYKSKEKKRLVVFHLSGAGRNGNEYNDKAIALYFGEEASEGWDTRDATKLTPLLEKYVNLAFVEERSGETRLKAQESRGYHPGAFEVPVLLISRGVDGTFTLNIDKQSDIPDDWKIEIIDHYTGETGILTGSKGYTFEVTATHEAAKRKTNIHPAKPVSLSVDGEDRFTLKVSPGPPGSNQIPAKAELLQNYPNPFNPATVIRYGVPEGFRGNVQLTVYDLLGRKVATLIDKQRSPGRYQVSFDASRLASGLYIYRLKAGRNVLTKKMMLIK